MALGNRYKTAPGAGTVAALILVLVFGSPWYADWVEANTKASTAGGWWLRLLTWPHWTFDSSDSLRQIIVTDLKAILLIVLTALFLFLLPGSQLARARGTISQFFAGWAAYIFAAARAELALLSAILELWLPLCGLRPLSCQPQLQDRGGSRWSPPPRSAPLR